LAAEPVPLTVATMAEALLSLKGKRVWVAGHRGMVGSAIVRRLAQEDCDLLTVERSDVDLRRQAKVDQWVADQTPDVIFVAAGLVGGIEANDRSPGAFLYDNLMIAANIMEAARQSRVAKLLFLGSSCIYPKFAPQPIQEEAMLTGPLEPTNQWYAIAKIAGIKLTQAYGREYGCDFVSIQPTNLYGPGDNFDPSTSHVPAALLRRFHEAKIEGRTDVTVWGTGTPRREFLYVDDLADACVFVMQHYSGSDPLNVGTGEDVTIAEFARLIAETVGYKGNIVFDRTKPDGTPRKLLDVSRLASQDWRARTKLEEGLKHYYAAFLSNLGG
jgi:GDP-L-fucose synthase